MLQNTGLHFRHKEETDNRFHVVTASASLTPEDKQVILVDASAGAVTVTLPKISQVLGRRYIIKKIDSSANEVTIDGDGTETIDGETTMIINQQYDAMQIVPNGTDWSII